MRNFKQNQHKLSNNHVQFSNRNLCKFEPPSKKSWIRPIYHLFYLIYMGQPIWDPYGTRLHCPYGSHMGFSNARFLRSLSVRGGGGSLFFSACVGSSPASTFHPQKYQEFQAPQNFFTRAYVYMKKSEYPPPPPPEVFLHSYTRCPSESDKTGVMKIATRQ